MNSMARRLLLLALAGLFLPASAQAYGVTLQERLSTGAPGASPAATLVGTITYNGDERTAILGFGIDQALLPQASIEALAAAPPGTPIGSITSDVTGATTPLAVRINTAPPSVLPGRPPSFTGAIDVPPLFAGLGAGPLPFSLTFSGGQAVFAVSLQAVDQRLSEAGLGSLRPTELTLVLDGAHLVVPAVPTTVTSTLTAQPCTGTSCALGAPASTAVIGSLPRALTFSAPTIARYGVLTSLTGRGGPGDALQLSTRTPDGEERRTGLGGSVGADGTYALRVRLRATATYALLDVQPGGLVVAADGAASTRIVLAAPVIRWTRISHRRLKIEVSVPGGDPGVTLELRVGSRRLAAYPRGQRADGRSPSPCRGSRPRSGPPPGSRASRRRARPGASRRSIRRMRVLCVHQEPDSQLYSLEGPVHVRGHELVVWHAYRGDPLPDVSDYGAAFALGGIVHPDQDDQHAWLEPERQLLRDLVAADVPTLAICLGGQLLAQALGAKAHRLDAVELGWVEIQRSSEGRRDPLLGGFPDRFPAFEWHQYGFTVPDGAISLAASPGRAGAGLPLRRARLEPAVPHRGQRRHDRAVDAPGARGDRVAGRLARGDPGRHRPLRRRVRPPGRRALAPLPGAGRGARRAAAGECVARIRGDGRADNAGRRHPDRGSDAALRLPDPPAGRTSRRPPRAGPPRPPLRGRAPGAARPPGAHDLEGRGRRPVGPSGVTQLALKEWAVAVDAIARGDMLVTLRKGGIREKEFLVEGERFWLLPTYEHQNAAQTKPLWHRDLGASAAARPAGGQLALRCLCVVHAAHPLEDAASVAALEPFHLWTPGLRRGAPRLAAAKAAVGARAAGLRAARAGAAAASRRVRRLPFLDRARRGAVRRRASSRALTDEAFALHAERVAAALAAVPAVS